MSTTSSNVEMNPVVDAVEDASAWKHELNERLQATRARRSQKAAPDALPGPDHGKPESRAARLAAKVAERYAKAPSYSEILAAEARAAAAAAEAAANAARQVCSTVAAMERAQAPGQKAPPAVEPQRTEAAASAVAPVEDEIPEPAQLLPVNLIEFPRELVAARRARPRLAEGPLRENAQPASCDQLRIFEVEPADISKAVQLDAPAPEWSSIRLDAKPAAMPNDEERSSSHEFPLQAASLEDRLIAGIFDIALVLLAFVLFVLVFAACTPHPPADKAALLAGGLVLAGLFLLYQYLFFRFTEGTPGMRYAKIALCTFDDENPTRKAMRRRIPFLVLSALPLGLGFAWAWLDADRLGWHDRITRMYQRSYR